jgi:hypothetical protein
MITNKIIRMQRKITKNCTNNDRFGCALKNDSSTRLFGKKTGKKYQSDSVMEKRALDYRS